MGALNDYFKQKREGHRPREHHCTGCCEQCKKDVLREGRSLEPAAVRRLRCHAEQGKTDVALLLSLGGNGRTVAWPAVVGQTLKDAPILNLPFRELYKSHAKEATQAARCLFKSCCIVARGSSLERLTHTNVALHFPRNTLLLHSIGDWSHQGGLDELADSIQCVLGLGADLSEHDTTGCTALHYAAGRGFREDILQLLCGVRTAGEASPALANARDHEGRTPLHAACEEGEARAALSLLSFGADPAVPNTCGLTPLHKAVEYSAYTDTALVERLLCRLCTHSAVAVRSDRGWTALHVAAYALSPLAVRVLLSSGADPESRCDEPRGYAPIQLASLHHLKASHARSGTREAFARVIRALDAASDE